MECTCLPIYKCLNSLHENVKRMRLNYCFALHISETSSFRFKENACTIWNGEEEGETAMLMLNRLQYIVKLKIYCKAPLLFLKSKMELCDHKSCMKNCN